MGKRGYLLLSILFSALVITIVVIAFSPSAYRTNPLSDIVSVDPASVTKVSLNSPVLNTRFRSTIDPEKINMLVHHLEQVEYKRLKNDQSSYMPTRAGMIYLYEGKKVDFMIPYEKEVMINSKVYCVKGNIIDNDFLEDFYQSLEEE